jgi:hypothetical protein
VIIKVAISQPALSGPKFLGLDTRVLMKPEVTMATNSFAAISLMSVGKMS